MTSDLACMHIETVTFNLPEVFSSCLYFLDTEGKGTHDSSEKGESRVMGFRFCFPVLLLLSLRSLYFPPAPGQINLKFSLYLLPCTFLSELNFSFSFFFFPIVPLFSIVKKKKCWFVFIFVSSKFSVT